MSDNILEAYCIDLNAVVDIEEAREAYFTQNPPFKRFTFLCSDETCRKLINPPEIIGVNYSAKQYQKAPHFRRNPEHKHAESCIWSVYNDIFNRLIKKKAIYKDKSEKNLFLEFTDFDSNSVFDELSVPLQSNSSQKYTETICKNTSLQHQIEQYILFTPKKTSSLANVVDLFRKLSDTNKQIAQITLPNSPKLSYRKAFKPVQAAKEYFTWTHIYYGSARIYRYEKNTSGYRIFFQNSAHYTDTNELFEVTAFISDAEIAERKVPLNLVKSLKKYADKKELCCCYILASATQRQKVELSGGVSKEFVVILHDSLRPIVLRDISPKCE